MELAPLNALDVFDVLERGDQVVRARLPEDFRFEVVARVAVAPEVDVDFFAGPEFYVVVAVARRCHKQPACARLDDRRHVHFAGGYSLQVEPLVGFQFARGFYRREPGPLAEEDHVANQPQPLGVGLTYGSRNGGTLLLQAGVEQLERCEDAIRKLDFAYADEMPEQADLVGRKPAHHGELVEVGVALLAGPRSSDLARDHVVDQEKGDEAQDDRDHPPQAGGAGRGRPE